MSRPQPHHSAPDPPDRSRWQRVENEAWPLSDKGGQHARGIPAAAQPIPVEARLVWSRDGEEWIPARAERWTRTHVCVYTSDPRLQVPYVWLLAKDVRRRV